MFVYGSFGMLAGFLLSVALPAEAATYFVTVNGSGFSPATLEIEPGDTVIWENGDDIFSHSTTSDLALFDPNFWNGLLVDVGDTFALTFNNLGTFTYHDVLGSGTGTISVSLPTPPGILLESVRQEGSQLLFAATGLTPGKTNLLQASTNLTAWVPIRTNVANDVSLTFTNTITLPRRFFRLAELP
jgi:plastocyanin